MIKSEIFHNFIATTRWFSCAARTRCAPHILMLKQVLVPGLTTRTSRVSSTEVAISKMNARIHPDANLWDGAGLTVGAVAIIVMLPAELQCSILCTLRWAIANINNSRSWPPGTAGGALIERLIAAVQRVSCCASWIDTFLIYCAPPIHHWWNSQQEHCSWNYSNQHHPLHHHLKMATWRSTIYLVCLEHFQI